MLLPTAISLVLPLHAEYCCFYSIFCSSSVKELEEPDVLVKLLSIAGSNCIYCHQWKEGAQKGIDRFKTLLKGEEEECNNDIFYAFL